MCSFGLYCSTHITTRKWKPSNFVEKVQYVVEKDWPIFEVPILMASRPSAQHAAPDEPDEAGTVVW